MGAAGGKSMPELIPLPLKSGTTVGVPLMVVDTLTSVGGAVIGPAAGDQLKVPVKLESALEVRMGTENEAPVLPLVIEELNIERVPLFELNPVTLLVEWFRDCPDCGANDDRLPLVKPVVEEFCEILDVLMIGIEADAEE